MIRDYIEMLNKRTSILQSYLDKLSVPQSKICSREFYHFFFSINFGQDMLVIAKDITSLHSAKIQDAATIRYLFLIARNACEQLIEYLYCMQSSDNDRIENFFALTTDFERKLCDNKKNKSIFEPFLRLGSGRFHVPKRPTVFNMCSEIGHVISTDNENSTDTDTGITLYEIYQLLSEYDHNSYFLELVRDVGLIGDVQSDSSIDTEDNANPDLGVLCIIVCSLLDYFLETLT